MSKRFIEPNRKQVELRPYDIERLIPEYHKARSVWDLTGKIDLSAFEERYKVEDDTVGRSAFQPRLLLSLWLYGYSAGIFSCRKLEEACKENNAFIWMCGGLEPSYGALNDFRKDNEEGFRCALIEGLAVMASVGLIDLSDIYQDGSKISANASNASAVTEEKLKRLFEEARQALERLDAMSEEEKEQLGKRKVAARHRAVRERLDRIEHAFEIMPERKERRRKAKLDESETKVSTTDPDSNKMKDKDNGYHQSYNFQTAVDGKSGAIVGASREKNRRRHREGDI